MQRHRHDVTSNAHFLPLHGLQDGLGDGMGREEERVGEEDRGGGVGGGGVVGT